nr:AMP-binding protein [Kofleriaceae bacterium]
MATFLDHVYDHEQRRGDAVWLVQPMGDGSLRELSWRAALDESRRVASHLLGLGYPPGSRIAILARNSAWWILADLAIWMAGHVSVPLYPTTTADTVRTVLEHSEARAIVVGKLDAYATMAPGIPDGLHRIAMPLAPAAAVASADARWEDLVAGNALLAGRISRPPGDLATIIYTSGSTGVPKGVMHSFGTMTASFVLAERTQLGPTDRLFSYLPLAHVYERACLEVCGFKSGARIYFTDSQDTFVDDIRRARPTLFVSVPRLWLKFQQAVLARLPADKLAVMLANPATRDAVRAQVLEGLGLADVRHAASGSAAIPGALLEWYRALGLNLFEGYAMTENFCVSHTTYEGEIRIGYVGRPVAGVEQRLTDDGELFVRSPGTMLGYYKDRALTDDTLGADGFLRTGDRGELDDQGRLRITGRAKELFKTSKGKYVAPVPIENAVMTHEAVEQALVSGANMPQPYALVVLAESLRPKLGELRASLDAALREHLARVNDKLDPHERLGRIVVVGEPWSIENGLLTPTLKVRRAVIEARYAGSVDGWYAQPDPVIWA